MSCSAAQSSMQIRTTVLQVVPDFLGAGDQIRTPTQGMARHDGFLLSQTASGGVCAGTSLSVSTNTKYTHGIPTWDQALEKVLPVEETVTSSNLDRVEKIARRPCSTRATCCIPYRASAGKEPATLELWGSLPAGLCRVAEWQRGLVDADRMPSCKGIDARSFR